MIPAKLMLWALFRRLLWLVYRRWRTVGILVLGIIVWADVFRDHSETLLFVDLLKYNEQESKINEYMNWVIVDTCDVPETSGIPNWGVYCHQMLEVFDPRQIPAVWIEMLNENVDSFDQMQLPFSWEALLGYKDVSPEYETCDSFFDDFNIPIAGENRTLYCRNENGVELYRPLDVFSSKFGLHKYAYAYLSGSDIPKRVVFLVGNSSFVIPLYYSEMAAKTINFAHQVDRFRQNMDTLPITNDSFPAVEYPRRVLLKTEVRLDRNDFLFSYDEVLKGLDHKVSGHQLREYNLDYAMLDSITEQLSQSYDAPKYFHEPLIKGAGHFDWRFFKQIEHSDYEHISRLHKLTRAWLAFSGSIGIQTWLAHGTLLGWYWNGMNLPWDNDLDVQITMKSLVQLARNYNQLVIVNLEGDGVGTYLLDVSTHIYERTKLNGKNVIDARFIDVHSGLYVDITALSFTEAFKDVSISKKQLVEFNQMLDADYLDKQKSQTLAISELNKQLFTKRAELYSNQEIYNCKNNHFYALEELQLEPLIFEGERAYIPRGYEGILKREYRRGLYYKMFNKHSYNPVLKLWIRTSVCNYEKSSICDDKEVQAYHKVTLPMTYAHKQNMYYKKRMQPMGTKMVDPWMVANAKRLSN